MYEAINKAVNIYLDIEQKINKNNIFYNNHGIVNTRKRSSRNNNDKYKQ